MTKIKLLSIMMLFISITTFSQIINISDPDFKNALLHSNCVDTNLDGFGEFDADINNDGEIQVTEAESILGLILFNENIHSLSGIENFINLELLLCNTNEIATLDLSQNPKLVHLNCGGNQLTSLDLSPLSDLEVLKCHANMLTSLDVSQNLDLNYFNCSGNNLSSLDTSQNMSLYWLICSENPLLTAVDVSNNVGLGYLYCVGNNLTQLDMSHNTNLIGLRCEDNHLTSLNIANGNNSNLFRMFSFDNPDLTCIQVDDDTYSFPTCAYDDLFEGWCKDELANYSNSCGLAVDSFTYNQLTISPNPANSYLTIDVDRPVESVKIVSLQGGFVKEINQEKIIDISQLESGIYILEIEINKQRYFKKFIKE